MTAPLLNDVQFYAELTSEIQPKGPASITYNEGLSFFSIKCCWISSNHQNKFGA